MRLSLKSRLSTTLATLALTLGVLFSTSSQAGFRVGIEYRDHRSGYHDDRRYNHRPYYREHGHGHGHHRSGKHHRKYRGKHHRKYRGKRRVLRQTRRLLRQVRDIQYRLDRQNRRYSPHYSGGHDHRRGYRYCPEYH